MQLHSCVVQYDTSTVGRDVVEDFEDVQRLGAARLAGGPEEHRGCLSSHRRPFPGPEKEACREGVEEEERAEGTGEGTPSVWLRWWDTGARNGEGARSAPFTTNGGRWRRIILEEGTPVEGGEGRRGDYMEKQTESSNFIKPTMS